MKVVNTISLIILILCSLPAFTQKLAVTRLTVEYKKDPLGIESSSPSLSWQLISHEQNVLQTAYQVLVADQVELLKKDSGNIWDSKKRSSDQSILVKYNGRVLESAKTYYWKVKVWNNKGHSSWSKVAQWQMGLLSQDDWKQAQWIAFEKIPDSLIDILPTDGKKDTYRGNNIQPLLRKTFDVNKVVKRATLFICGLGHFEASINGKKIGDHFLDPGWTKYDQQALYVPFDVTGYLQKGKNAIGVMLGNGFYYIPPVANRYRKLRGAFGFPKMIARLSIEFTDGSFGNIVSDPSWKTSDGPVRFSSIYGGEDYDANMEHPGWDQTWFDDRSWKNVVEVDGPPVISAQLIEPVKVMETFSPKKTASLGKGIWMYDLGQNASGIPRISLQGKKGDTVRIIPAELLNANGSANQKASGAPYYFDYVLKGDGIETWQPRFTYYGFRYLQVQGVVPRDSVNPDGLPLLFEIKGLHIRNAAEKTGTFSCSNQLFNQTYKLIDWAIRSNMVSVFTDCPHREKLGWLEQAHLMGTSVHYNYDAVNLFRKLVADMKYSQTQEGLVPEIAPEYVKFDWGNGMFRDSPEWGSSCIIVPWYLYQWYGDKDILEESYPLMVRYESYLRKQAKDFILRQGLGDWYDLGPKAPGVSQLTPMGITATATYYYDLGILSRVSEILGKEKEAKDYVNLAMKVQRAFNDSFFNISTRQYGSGSQAANAIAVYMGLVYPEYRDDVINNIVSDVRAHGNRLTAGDIGYRYLLCVLDEAGRDDVIFDMNSKTDVPGYGWQISKGATALTESWSALSTNSNNHFMLGHIMEWFYRGLAGIGQSDSSVGYRQLIIRPGMVGDVKWAKGSYETPYGIVKSEWMIEGSQCKLKVTIPANATAVICLPDGSKVNRGSGSYIFQAKK